MRFVLLFSLAISAFAATPDGAAIFEKHCAACHQTETGSRTPTRAELASLTPEQVMNALLRGKMTIQGTALATSEVRAVSLYVTGKNWSVPQVDAAAGRCSGNPKPFSPGSGDWNRAPAFKPRMHPASNSNGPLDSLTTHKPPDKPSS
jgi:hypothetical protein